jgi:predicted unusual protein kinase regulating ubiquinone biosynthesis (AarF/ABC1/UbiB family)
MIFMRLLPGVLKELVKHVPTILFQVIEWKDLASELPKISRRILQKEGYDAIKEEQEKLLAPFPITLTKENLSSQKMIVDKAVGEAFLELYFAQLYSKDGLFLDLRTQNFSWEKNHLLWNPTGFWTKFSDSFRDGLTKVYDGFYLEDEALYYDGLKSIGLISDDWSEADKKKLGDLFKDQFGKALDQPMNFSLKHFQQSIFKMADFILQKKTKISKDFLYLGIYLVTLYSSLDQTEEKLPVKEIYLRVRSKFR